MLKKIHCHSSFQLCLGLLTGVVFGFLLHKGGATRYDVIVGQLLLTDFTVVKIMLSAVVTGMIGVHALKSVGLARLHVKSGSFGSSVIGGLIFGVGFGVLGYCPGTVAGAVGQGSLDALFSGFVGILIGSWLFAAMYPKLREILNKGYFGEITLPELLGVNAWAVIAPLSAAIITLLFWMEKSGL
jgi:uncharacterized membrane protein YedE/YeeE